MLLLKYLKNYFERGDVSRSYYSNDMRYSYNNYFAFPRMRYVVQEYASVHEDSMMRARVTHNENLSYDTPKTEVIAYSLLIDCFVDQSCVCFVSYMPSLYYFYIYLLIYVTY